MVTKDFVRLKLQEVEQRAGNFEKRFGMTFEKFQQAWKNDLIPDKYPYEVEKDYWEWETLHADLPRLREILANLP